MCDKCYREYGSPVIDNDGVRTAAERIHWVYDISPVGGNLHIVLDDWNLEDEDLDQCLEYVRKNHFEHTANEIDCELACLRVLRELTVAERASALHMAFAG